MNNNRIPEMRFCRSIVDIRQIFSFMSGLAVLTVALIFCIASEARSDQFGISRKNNNRLLGTGRSQENTAPSQKPALPELSSPASSYAEPFGKVGSAVRVSLPAESRSNDSRPGSNAALPNVVRLIAMDKSGLSFGSGSYIGTHGAYGLILSNWHVICETDGLVHVHFPNGFSSFGAIIASDRKWDLAVIVISRPPETILPISIARTIPKPGEPLWIAGHGSGTYRMAGGRCVRYLAPEIPEDGTAPQYEIIDLSVNARQGDSGGPILNAKGELAGVLFGSDMIGNTAGSHCERVDRFLRQAESYLKRLPDQPERHFASIEPEGPRKQLTETVYSASAGKPASPTVHSNSAAGAFDGLGVRSPSRRYTQPGATPPVFETPAPAPTPVPAPAPTVTPNPRERNEYRRRRMEMPPLSERTPQIQPTVMESRESRNAQSVQFAGVPTLPRENRNRSSIRQVTHSTLVQGAAEEARLPKDVFENDLSGLLPIGSQSNEYHKFEQTHSLNAPQAQIARVEGVYGQAPSGRTGPCSSGQAPTHSASSLIQTHPAGDELLLNLLNICALIVISFVLGLSSYLLLDKYRPCVKRPAADVPAE